MSSKLQEITDELYEKGIEKAQFDSGKLMKETEAKALQIIADAQEKAQSIIAKAEEKAHSVETDMNNTLRIASEEMLANIQSSISDSVTFALFSDAVDTVIGDHSLLQSIVVQIIEQNNSTSASASASHFKLEIAQASYAEFEAILRTVLASDIQIVGNDAFTSGFRLINTKEKYRIDFTAETLMNLIKNTVGGKVYEILFRS